MAFCTNCGAQLPEGVSFCPGCGNRVAAPAPQAPEAVNEPVYQEPVAAQPVYQEPVAAQPVYQEPVAAQPVYQAPQYQQPTYQYAQQPVYEAQPVVQPKSKVMGFIGMGLGIGALVFGIIAVIFSLVGFSSHYAASYAVGYGVVAIGLGVPAKILSAKAIGGGFVGTPTKLGNVFGLIGLIMGGVSFFFGIIGVAL